ncbi:MAG: hypothetical protein EP150_01705 [Prevotella copri]|nr:hypothetical protein [Segatella copri]
MNIKNVMMMAAMMPAFALAETNSNCAPVSVEANDTTIRVNDQNIVIKQDGEQTSVKIYKMNGNEMTKISETQFVDGQEVEKVFVTSPFIPQTLSKRKRSLESHYPTFFFGCSQLPGSRGSMGGNNEMHSRDSKSWEWGITLTSLCFRLSNEMALTSSLHRTDTPSFQGQLCIKHRKRGIGNDADRWRDAEEKLYQLQCAPPAYHAGVAKAHRMP